MELQSAINNINAITDAVIKVLGFFQDQVLENIPAEKWILCRGVFKIRAGPLCVGVLV